MPVTKVVFKISTIFSSPQVQDLAIGTANNKENLPSSKLLVSKTQGEAYGRMQHSKVRHPISNMYIMDI